MEDKCGEVGQYVTDEWMERIGDAQRGDPEITLGRTGRGFDLIAQRKFLWQIIKQCSFAVWAYGAMCGVNEITCRQIDVSPMDDQDFWEMHLQSFLISAATISRMLWVSGKGSPLPERPRRLRQILEVDNNSVLRNRDLRNFFEHYDERLDHWAVGKASAEFDPLFSINMPADRDELGYPDYEVGDDDYRIPLRPIVRALIELKAKAESVRGTVMEQIEAGGTA